MIGTLTQSQNVTLLLSKEVKDLTQEDDKTWKIQIGATDGSDDHSTVTSSFIFL